MLTKGCEQQNIYSVFLYCLKHKLSRTYKWQLLIWEYWFTVYCLQVSLLIIRPWISSAIRNIGIKTISLAAYIFGKHMVPPVSTITALRPQKISLCSAKTFSPKELTTQAWTTLWARTSTYWDIFLHYVKAIGVGPLGCT